MELETQSSNYTVDHSRINVEDRTISLFEPDTLVSAQYWENLRRKNLLEPEKRLMLAVLEDAINCFQINVMAQNGRRKKLFNESEDWIMGRDDDWIFSFVSICELLRLNPEYVRRGLLRWKEKKLARNPMPYSRGKENDGRVQSSGNWPFMNSARTRWRPRLKNRSCGAFEVRHQKLTRLNINTEEECL